MIVTVFVALLVAVQLYLLFNAVFLYYPLIGAIAARFWPKPALAAPEVLPGRLAVLLAAHNEQAVLGGSLQALGQSRYPRKAYEVFVVADNCKDDTAAVARAHGVRVYERFSDGPSTKGQALAWLWSQLPRQEFAGVVVLDADNHVDAGFLPAMASALGHGYPAVQGIRRAKNAEGGTAGLDALTELCSHRIGAAGRRALGLNGPLMGSGVGYQAALFERLIREVGETVVEDCEWQAKLALERTAIAWTDRAVIYDEKTSRADAMQTQRNRWMAGRGQVARAYLRPLLLAGLKGNLDALDMAAFLLTVPRVLALAGFGAFWLLALALPHLPGLLPAWIWFACLAGFALYVIAGLALDGAPASAYMVLFRGTLQLPRFALQMARATWKALSGSAVKWVPTPHGR